MLRWSQVSSLIEKTLATATPPEAAKLKAAEAKEAAWEAKKHVKHAKAPAPK